MHCLQFNHLTLELGGRQLCQNLSLTINRNERWALLGKNGAGKTTLLHAVIGLHQPASGEIRIQDKPLASWTRQALAQFVGILFQEGIHSLPSTVLESVLLGRHPHTHSLFVDNVDDLEIAREALRDLDMAELAEREISSLSGGEKQRLALAMLVAQQPCLYLLDEPSNHLDLAFQVKLLSALQKRMTERSASLLMATHDINLAARFCDRFILLDGKGEALVGDRSSVLTEAALSQAYDCEMRIADASGMHFYYPAN